MTCSRCGSEVPAGNAFCPQCGLRIEPAPEAAATPSGVGAPAAGAEPSPPAAEWSAPSYQPPPPGWPPSSSGSPPWQTPGYPPPPAAGVQLAGFWPRFGALIVDGFLFTVGFWVLFWILETLDPSGSGTSRFFMPLYLLDPSSIIVAFSAARGTSGFFMPLYLLVFIGEVAYFTWGYGSGQTIGCKALSLRIVDQNTGGPPGYGKGLGRFFAQILSGIPLYLGYLWAIWDPKKQTWHDKLAGTLVLSNATATTYTGFGQG